MQTLEHGYRGFNLLVRLNADRLLWPAGIALALWLATGLGHALS